MAAPTTIRSRRPFSMLRSLLDNEASGGLVLMAAAALALVVANSPLAPAYFAALHAPIQARSACRTGSTTG
jgi:NhaA family Na+:H+ antiporter